MRGSDWSQTSLQTAVGGMEISPTLDFGFNFVKKKSAAYTWAFTVIWFFLSVFT